MSGCELSRMKCLCVLYYNAERNPAQKCFHSICMLWFSIWFVQVPGLYCLYIIHQDEVLKSILVALWQLVDRYFYPSCRGLTTAGCSTKTAWLKSLHEYRASYSRHTGLHQAIAALRLGPDLPVFPPYKLAEIPSKSSPNYRQTWSHLIIYSMKLGWSWTLLRQSSRWYVSLTHLMICDCVLTCKGEHILPVRLPGNFRLCKYCRCPLP